MLWVVKTSWLIDKRTYDTSIKVTFTYEAPSGYKGLPNITEIYQGGYFELDRNMNYFVGIESDDWGILPSTNESSDFTYLRIDDEKDTYIFKAPPELKEPFTINITVFNMFGGSYSLFTHVLSVIACPQSDCNAWTGLGPADCIGWETNFSLDDDGKWVRSSEGNSNDGDDGSSEGDSNGDDSSGGDSSSGDGSNGGDTSGDNSNSGNSGNDNSGNDSSGGESNSVNDSNGGGSSSGDSSQGNSSSSNSNEGSNGSDFNSDLNENSSSDSTTKDYLDRNVTVNENAEVGVGASVAVGTVTVSSVSVVGGSASASAGVGISQCQAAQFMCLFNMDIPDEYIEYWKSLSSTQLNFEFVDTIGITDFMEDEYTGRNLASKGYKNLSNIGLNHASFLITFMFFFIFLLLIIMLHLFIIWLDRKISKGSDSENCLKKLRGYLEYGVYFYIIVFASPFMFLVSLNEIAAFETSTGFRAFSFVFSLLSFLILIVVALLPVISMWMKKREKNFFSGLKESWKAKIFYTIVMVKFLVFSMIFILLDFKEIQLSSFLLVLIISCTYLVKIKPFVIPISNTMVIMNEGMLLLVGLLMISFLDSALSHSIQAKIIIYALSANIIICFCLAIISQLYSLCKKNKKKNAVMPEEIGKIVNKSNVYRASWRV